MGLACPLNLPPKSKSTCVNVGLWPQPWPQSPYCQDPVGTTRIASRQKKMITSDHGPLKLCVP